MTAEENNTVAAKVFSKQDDDFEEVEELLEKNLSSEVTDRNKFCEEQLDKIEHKNRSQHITKILGNYSEQQKKRFEDKIGLRGKVVRWLVVIMILLALDSSAMVVAAFVQEINAELVAVVITGCVSFLGSLLTVLAIVVKYLFPPDEEQNFNALVAAIIENDTKQKKNEFDFISCNSKEKG